ncbi:hypothetical protein D3C72_2258530 [compost metagenome]
MGAHGSGPSDNDGRRRAAHAVAMHRARYRSIGRCGVDADRERQPVFVDEGFESLRTHRRMVFKDRVQPDHLKVRVAKEALHALRLRQPV